MEVPDARTQAMGSHQMEGLLVCPKNQLQQQQQQQERKPRPHPEQALKCPRCASTNTKFCYYNNYSLSQPRYFCKGCRRYWTQGGSLRNVPVGGGCRKNKRPSSSSSSKKAAPDHQDLITATNSFNPLLPPPFINPPVLPSDLTLTFAGLHKQSHAPSLLLGHANSTESLLNHAVSTNNGFLDTATPSGLSNLYYGLGASTDGGVGSGEDGLLSFNEGGLGDAAARRVTSQGSCKDMQDEGYQSQTKVMMGLPWQVGGDGRMAAVDAAGLRDWSTTGVNGSSWHGLISSSQLMSGARIDMPSTLGDAYAFF